MKKIICILLAMILVFTCVSCNRGEPDASGNPSETGEQTTKTPPVLPEKQQSPYFFPAVKPFSESATRLLYLSGGILYYYNKITGEDNLFCFDPLCKHGLNGSCLAYLFPMSGTLQTIEYCAADNRFYALRGKQFCSFAFDGSDLRVVHSFGEDGSFEGDQLLGYMYGGLVNLQVAGQNVFFIANDLDTGKHNLMRYDTVKKEMTVVYAGGTTAVRSYLARDNVLYLCLVGENTGLFRMEVGKEQTEKILDTVVENLADDAIFDGETLYYVQSQLQEDGKTNRYVIHSLSFVTGEDRKILPIDDTVDGCFLLADNADYLYYTLMDNLVIGYTVSDYGKWEVKNQCSKIYRLDKKSGEVLTVLDDIHCDTDDMYILGDTVWIMGTVCEPHETRAGGNGGSFTAKIGKDGTFTDLQILHIVGQ